jgi:3-methylcrotonyl-CoA carboxylase alpha subunit
MFEKLLIANRGEIACRVMRTARGMGIRTVAVFSDADAKALHVEMADEAVHIGPSPARDSYLRADRIIDAAKRTGAQAIHPGYGFLSENADFAEACAAAGIVFVGPSPAAIRAMGSKAEAKRLMQAAGVPLVPGYHGEDQSDALLAEEAARIGFPVLIKASAGGGGRGMRAVERAEDFAAQLAAASREAEAAFGDGRVLLEKYLQRPRHIEVQLLGDTHGTLLHLGTRDCSIQRRHQKIVEEAPAPGLSDATRERIHQAALAAGRAVNYSNTGTVEFIAEGIGEDPRFYFMEMNTRLQVEHPVTEMVYGIDLVEQQLRVAAGERLTLAQDALVPEYHAIEVRLCAEDPRQDFRPSVGRIYGRQWDSSFSTSTRFDDGFRVGDRITPYYDNLLGKIIVWEPTREAAVEALGLTLAWYAVGGLQTNLELLRRIIAHPEFRSADTDTGFIARNVVDLIPARRHPPQLVSVIAALCQDAMARAAVRRLRTGSSDHSSPWNGLEGFRLLGRSYRVISIGIGGEHHTVRLSYRSDGTWVQCAGEDMVLGSISPWRLHGPDIFPARALTEDDAFVAGSISAQGRFESAQAMVLRDGNAWQITVQDDPEPYDLTLLDPYAPPEAAAAAADRIAAPIPALVARVDVAAGDAVTRGQVLAMLEAMKTEIRITAPADGIVDAVLVTAGQQVAEGTELVRLA